MVKKVFAKGYVYTLLLFLYAPIFLLIIFSFTDSEVLGVWNGFTFDLYAKMFKNKDMTTALTNTLTIAFVSSLISTVIGTMGAIGIYYLKGKLKKSANFLSQIPVMNAEIVMALSLALFFVSLGMSKSFTTLVIGHVVLTAPFVVLSVIPKLKQIDPNIYEAALDLGATPKVAMFKVMVPEIIPGIASGFLLALTLSLDDYIITAFTRKQTYDTLSTYVEGATKRGALPNALRALTTFMFIFIFLILLLVNYRVSKIEEKNKKKR